MKIPKYLIYPVFLLILGCSFDTSSSVRNNPKEENIKINNSTILNETISFNNFKKEVIKYSNNLDYPAIN